MTNKQKKILKDWIKFLLAISGIIGLLFFYVFYAWSPIKTTVSIVVEKGTSVTALSKYLYEHNIINSTELFDLSIKLNGGKILAGEYDFERGTGVWPIASMLSHGNVAITTVTIPEGYTLKQTKLLLQSTPSLSGEVNCISDAPVCKLNDGDIFPDTYHIARGIGRLAVLDLARQKMNNVKQQFMNKNVVFPEPLKNWNDVMSLASIVQKETPNVKEMPIVAGVYLNRLRLHMRLQADPTVVYALTDKLGDMKGKALLTNHLKISSPYNTYANYGLPPTPIANVGKDAIRAVLYPAHTPYLYFVADGKGGHLFSVDYSEHQKKHSVWRKIKEERNKK